MCAGATLNGQRLIEFRLGREAGEAGGALRALSAELLVRAESGPRASRRRYTLWAFTVRDNATLGELAGAARREAARAWQRLDVTRAVRSWLARGGAGALRLLVDCSGCAGGVRLRLAGAASARPLLRVRVTSSAAARRRRRSLDCASAPRGRCCRQSYYVEFRALGWDDWIVAPEGYHANFCHGECPREAARGHHAHVLWAARDPPACCAPLRFSALSLVYFGADSNIVKRDLPEMVVEECGCP